MAYDVRSYYRMGFSEAKLLEKREALQSMSDLETAVSSINTPGLQLTFDKPTAPAEVLLAVNYALWRKNPTLYPEGRLVTSQVAIFH